MKMLIPKKDTNLRAGIRSQTVVGTLIETKATIQHSKVLTILRFMRNGHQLTLPLMCLRV